MSKKAVQVPNAETLQVWEAFLMEAARLGIKSWKVLRALMADASLDDATIAALQPKWTQLYDDVQRASHP